ncbi:hypothetical protein BCR43DRAFT_497079 [Syncephalastrum racemosum]|uniref:Uncharacterized protein n=1 Tax=Syncephalastrum racemosum TaxID=13706 RepID=A0A1X2H558_SYNRA|nr:hypothetical protein BCR43DRAFT_497079 [Syncephalastrum racemosum]
MFYVCLLISWCFLLFLHSEAHTASSKDLDTVAPTADKVTMHLADAGNSLAFARPDLPWNVGVVSNLQGVVCP